MENTVKQLLAQEGLSLCAPILLSECRVLRPHLLKRTEITDGTVFLLAAPYYTTKCEDPASKISKYAVSADYHIFFAALFERILPVLREKFPQNRFAGFADHSPIAEVEAAVRAGLGVLGKNGLLLCREYSSYVFLGEIVTDAVLPLPPALPLRECENCGACRRACPVNGDMERCLSALTQKKGELTEAEQDTLRKHGCAWGCDRCQDVCPYTVRAKATGTIYSPLPFFTQTALPRPDAATVAAMSDSAFADRAYAWRGRGPILRNLTLLEEGEHK